MGSGNQSHATARSTEIEEVEDGVLFFQLEVTLQTALACLE